MSRFFYNRIEKIKDEAGVDTEKIFRDSINLDKVLRTVQIADNLVIVILDDGREEKFDIPVVNKGRTEYQTQRRFVQTQIPIDGLEQVQRFFEKYDV